MKFKSCLVCEFWHKGERVPWVRECYGECRRHAPVLGGMDGDDTNWPTTRSTDVCGEFVFAGFEALTEEGSNNASAKV